MAEFVHVKGLVELNKFLQTLPVKVEKNALRGALRAGMNVVKPVAQERARKASGEYARGLTVGTRSKGGRVTASLKPKGKHAFLGPFIEFGTRAHIIAAKTGFLFFGGFFAKAVAHPGTKPHPHLRPALDSQAQNALIAAGEYLKKRLATKEGIDTSDIRVEGDE